MSELSRRLRHAAQFHRHDDLPGLATEAAARIDELETIVADLGHLLAACDPNAQPSQDPTQTLASLDAPVVT